MGTGKLRVKKLLVAVAVASWELQLRVVIMAINWKPLSDRNRYEIAKRAELLHV